MSYKRMATGLSHLAIEAVFEEVLRNVAPALERLRPGPGFMALQTTISFADRQLNAYGGLVSSSRSIVPAAPARRRTAFPSEIGVCEAHRPRANRPAFATASPCSEPLPIHRTSRLT